MTNEEKILERLDELTEEIREAKRAIRPYVELKKEIEPLLGDMMQEAIGKLSGLDKHFSLEDFGDMIGQLLVSSKNLTDALVTLNRFMEFKRDFEPYSKDIFHEVVSFLQTTCHGLEPGDMQDLFRQVVLNMGNMADGLKMLGTALEFKRDASTLSKLAFDDLVERLECLKQKGVFDAFEQVLDVTERVGSKLQHTDFDKVQPVRGVFGMMAALRRPEVQEGLGVLIELSTVMTALKEKKPVRCGSGQVAPA